MEISEGNKYIYFVFKKCAQEFNLINPDLFRYNIRTETTSFALWVLLHILISKQNNYEILENYIFSQGSRMEEIRLIAPTCVPVLCELWKWIVDCAFANSLTKSLRFQNKTCGKGNALFPCAVCNLGVAIVVQFLRKVWSTCTFALKSEIKTAL